MLKVLSGKKYRFSTNELHKELNILKVEDIAKQEILTFVHNFFANKLPPVFDNYFETFETCHNRNTRSGANKIKITKHKTNIASLSIKIKGAYLWNKLSNDLKAIPNTKNFRIRYKESLLISC